MTRSRAVRLVGLFLLALPGAALAQELAPPEQYHLRLEYSRWSPALDSEFQNGSGERPGTLIDARDDLGVEDKKTFEARGAIQLKPGHKIRVGYTRLDYDGDVQHARRPFLYENTFYRKDSRIVSSLKGAYYAADYEFDLLKGRWGHLGGLVGAKVFDVDTVIVAPAEGKRDTSTQRAPIPVVGASMRFYVGRLSLGGEVSGLSLGKRGHLYEAGASGRFHFTERLAVGGGYRRLELRGEDEPDLIRLRLGGAHFGIEMSL